MSDHLQTVASHFHILDPGKGAHHISYALFDIYTILSYMLVCLLHTPLLFLVSVL